jgi:hypothetical protein
VTKTAGGGGGVGYHARVWDTIDKVGKVGETTIRFSIQPDCIVHEEVRLLLSSPHVRNNDNTVQKSSLTP